MSDAPGARAADGTARPGGDATPGTTAVPGAAVPGGGPALRVVPYGDDAVLVELPDLARVQTLEAAVRAREPSGVVDVVPAARTLLVRGRPRLRPAWAAEVVAAAREALGAGAPARPARTVEVPVVYDGEDLPDVARLTGLSVEEVVARHLAGGPDGYRVAFGGFMPGFAYVVGLDPRLHVARLPSPRTRVPAGAVAVAGEYTAVYPAATPGGWRLLGSTTLRLFDASRGTHDAALLRPGDAVRLVRAAPAPVLAADGPRPPVDAGTQTPSDGPVVAPQGGPDAGPGAGDDAAPPRALTVVEPGLLTLVEDAGRPGLAAVGVPRSGAADPVALVRANRLVGNAADAAVLEVLLGGLVVTFGAATAFALVGADPGAELDGVPVPTGVAVRAAAGATLALGAPAAGARTWLAVRGGVDVPPVLGSRSRDVLSGLGPAPLRAGDVLPYGVRFDGLPDVPLPDGHGAPAGIRVPGGAAAGVDDDAQDDDAQDDDAHDDGTGAPGARVVELPATRGPRADRLDAAGAARLSAQVWDVTPDSNRVAVRLDGPPLTLAVHDELPSEGLVPGAVQVPHDGRPVVFGPDHPVTGGYPVVAVLTAAGRSRAAQLRPGDRVRLVLVDAPPA